MEQNMEYAQKDKGLNETPKRTKGRQSFRPIRACVLLIALAMITYALFSLSDLGHIGIGSFGTILVGLVMCFFGIGIKV